MKTFATTKEFMARPDYDRYNAIIKPLEDGRHMMIGWELKNKRSRDYRSKFWLRTPVILEELVAARKHELAEIARTTPAPG